MDAFIELLNDIGIEYSMAEEYEPYVIMFNYKGEEFACDYCYSPEYELLYIHIVIEDLADSEAESYLAANSLRGDYYSCAIYPTIGVGYYHFDLPVSCDKKKEYFLKEVDNLLQVKSEFEQRFKEASDEISFEKEILEDALTLAEFKLLI